jgi:hypothetical protein
MITPPRIPHLPDITHVQFFVLESLMVCPLRGKDLRDELEEFGWLRTNETFPELINQLEKLGFVVGFYAVRILGDVELLDHRYELTVAGMRAYHRAHPFYSNGALDLAS